MVVAVIVPTPRWAGSVEYCAFASTMPRPSKASFTADEPSNSISPLVVISETDPPCPSTTCRSVNVKSSLMSRSRSSRSAGAGACVPELTIFAFTAAMPLKSSFARVTADAMRFSASVRRPWMPLAIEPIRVVSVVAASSTADRAVKEAGSERSVCSACVKPFMALSSAPFPPGCPNRRSISLANRAVSDV
jgi:hypothetical protein